ncbi:MAG: hypothetical protein FD161_967 [Limisphaerales bacterium]|nr:MAG: hypothetical protein FD161_967 [Limisphaerales bacterium]KAG0509750.1 MAG: hypothetical protein E1N63_967 [Limisphaerales bacterium]TXT51029.1 MAG: hypothetical protein FD140_2091 [Limisphaerales bacterium]
MKHTRQLLLIAVALLWTAALASAIPGRAEVKKVVGKATKTDAKGSPSTLSEGMILGTGDTVTTGAGSTVDLYLGLNGDFLRVDPDTTLKIDNLDIPNVAARTVTTQLSLGKGAITGNVINKPSLASKYEIKSASGVAGIRGTIYSVRTDATGRIQRIVVTQGTVTFNDRGQTITISATDGTARAYTPSQPGQPVNQNVEPATPTEATTTNATATASAGSVSTTTEAGTTTTVNNPSDTSVSQ